MNRPVLLLSSPPLHTPAFPTSSPEQEDVRPEPLEEAHAQILRRYPKMRSFLVVRHGRLIYERYYNEAEPGTLHDLRSATKSITSTLAGIAVSRRELPGLDEPLMPYLRDYARNVTAPLLEEVLTLRRLLTMSTGFRWQTGKTLGEPLIHRFHRSRAWTSFALSLPIDAHMAGVFQYRSIDSHLISVLISECCGTDAYSYARQHLFGPLGIEYAAWSSSPECHTMGHIGLYLTARDMAKFGLCCLNKGLWQNRPVIPEAWLEQALTRQLDGYPAFGDYGYQWWTGRMCGQPFSCAHGHGGQQIYLFPELDAVVVFTADSKVSRWRNPRSLLQQHILGSME